MMKHFFGNAPLRKTHHPLYPPRLPLIIKPHHRIIFQCRPKRIQQKHYVENQTCSQCGKVVKNLKALEYHIKDVHEKVPCAQCGKMYGSLALPRHIRSTHTPNEQKNYKCEVCGKGFITNQRLKDHNNIHTGEKPYKCKFCSASFASKGTHAMHQRGHLGHRRNSSKVL